MKPAELEARRNHRARDDKEKGRKTIWIVRGVDGESRGD